MNSDLNLLSFVKFSSRKSEIQFWSSGKRSRLQQNYCTKVKKKNKSVCGMTPLTRKKNKKRRGRAEVLGKYALRGWEEGK